MPWYVPWSENIKKRACRYLLQRYLGQFLEEKLTLDQLSVDLYNGTGTVSDVTLDCEALNELGEAQGWPLEFVDGFVQEMNVSIPWSTLLTDDSFVQVNGLSITIQPKQRSESATSMLESMWSSMTSSMQLAAECLKQEGDGPAAPQPVEGIELFAHTIDSILCRVKVRFSNTTIRMEHVPKDSSTGVALEIHIKNIDYLDEAGSDPPTELTEAEKNKTYVVSTFATKRITFEGVTFHTDEFPSKARTFARSVLLSESTWKAGGGTIDESDPYLDSRQTGNEASLYLSSETNPFITQRVSPDRSAGCNISEAPHPIVFGRLAGRQEVRLKMKQSEEAQGPKVDFQLTLGSLTLFLSPRQFHVLAELANGLAEPHLEDTSNVPARGHPGMESKPMQRMDFERVEAQLMGGMASERLPANPMAKHGWSTANIDDSDTEDDKFLPLAWKRDEVPMAESFASSGSMSSSITSNASSLPSLAATPRHRSGSPYNTRRKRTIPQVEGDPFAEVSQLHIRISSFACILLHEDILTLSASLGGDCLAASSVKQMKSTAEAFFESVGLFGVSGYGGRDFDTAGQAFDAAVACNHLRLIAAPLVLEGSEKTNSQGSSLSVQLTMARVDLRECLRTARPEEPTQTVSEAIPLLIFTREDEKLSKEFENMAGYMSNPLCKAPDIKISFKNTQKAMKIGGEKKYAYPRTEISTTLEPCTVEVDISIVDRMCALLNPQPLCGKSGGFCEDPSQTARDYYSDRDSALSDHYCELKFSCPLLRIKLRFPVADLRPAHDMSRCPWWKRSVRADFLVGDLRHASLTSISKTSAKETASIKVQCRKLDLYYVESEGDNEIHIGCASADEGSVNSEFPTSSTDWPSVSITVLPTPFLSGGLLDSSSDGEGTGMNLRYKSGGGKATVMGQSTAMLMDRLKSPAGGCSGGRPGPFSSKKMVHESDTPHAKDDEDDAEELVIPGDSAEMAEFVEFSIKNSLLQIQCNLPVVSLQLGSKHLYEILYNRINSDLLLWEPSAPKSVHRTAVPASLDPASLLAGFDMRESIYPAFSMCKSGINYNSDSESSSSSTDSNVYYSVYDQRARQNYRSKSMHKSVDRKERLGRMNNICFHLQIKKGLLTTYTPVRDSLNHVLPVQQGELVIVVSDLGICHVGGVGGDRRSALVSVQASTAQLYHCGLIPIPTEKMPLRLYGCTLPEHLKSTVYPSSSGVSVKDNAPSNGRDFLSVAVSVKPNKDYPCFKTIRVAAGIWTATLRHWMTASQHSWLNQLMDVFDVLDYPVAGYEPSTVVTELHVHLWDCAVDYRPIHLPLSTIITMGSFSVSSNVIAQTNASNLRFIAEECALFLSEEVTADSHSSVNLKRDYVCVLDLGLFELSLRLNDKNVTTAPRVDLRASNNAVHIRTCSDSFAALCRLVDYLAGDGDLAGPLAQDAASDSGQPDSSYANSTERDNATSADEDLLIGVVDRPPEEIRDLSQSQVQQVNDLMAEAMKESLNSDDMNPDDKNNGAGEGVEIFFFPDESKALKSLRNTSKNSSTTDISGNFAQDKATGSKDAEKNEILSDDMINEFSTEDGHQRDNSLTSEGDSLPPMAVVAKELGDFSVKSDTVEVNIVRSQPKAEDIMAFKTKPGHNKSSGENTDEEFCFIPRHEEAQSTEPEIRWLVEEPVTVLDNHFTIPIGKTDLLKPPKNFPMAVLRYTLCEMTVIWHMYGGHDFKQVEAGGEGGSPSQQPSRSSSLGPNRKTVTIDDQNEKHSPTVMRRECDPYKILPKSSSAPSTYYGQYQLGVRYSKGSESVTSAVPRTPGSPRQPPWRQRGGPARRHDVLIELQLNKVQFQHETYPAGGTQASRQVLIVSSVEIRDRLASSLINKFLHQYTSEQRPMRKHANMVVIKAVHVRPDRHLLAQECCLKVSLLPLRFNIDQDSLLFLISFFGNIGEGDTAKDGGMSSANSGSNQSLHSVGGSSSRHSTPTHQPPVMSVAPPRTARRNLSQPDNVMISSDCLSEDSLSLRDNDDENEGPMLNSYEAEQMVSENLIRLEEDCGTRPSETRSRGSISSGGGEPPQTNSQAAVNDAPIYFRSVVFSPEVPIRLDYQGKRVELSHGPLAGLLMGLGQLNCSELRLKRLSYRHGLLGVERLLKWALQEWLGDIKRHQLPGLLGGVGPMYSLVQLFQGIRDLFWLPIEQYQRDGRLVRGLQRGASSFTTSTAMAALDITARIIHLIQATAETAYDMVSPSPGLRGVRGKGRRRRERPRQPHDIREGVTNAYHLVKDGLGETAQALASVAAAERSARGYSGAVGGVLRQLPPTAIAPFLLASAAASRVLGGVRATLAPHHHRDHRDKWRATPGDDDEDEETRRWDGER